MQSDHIEELQRSIVQMWNLKPISQENPEWDDLLDVLARNISFLMRHDMHRLFTTCYLLDLSEELVSKALGDGSERGGARELAEIVLNRELKKLETRRHFRREGSVDLGTAGGTNHDKDANGT